MNASRRTLLGVAFAGAVMVAVMAPGSASAIQNGDPCSPFFTEVTAPEAQFLVVGSSLKSVNLKSFSNQGTADVWTYVSADDSCEATSTEGDPFSTYRWDFGDGSSTTSASPTISHTYSHAGTYDVTLTVTERDCQAGPHAHCFTGSTVSQLIIPDLPPVASFTAPASALTTRAVKFDASQSADPDGTIATYHWEFGDGQIQDTTSPSTSHTYGRSGPKIVTLTVTDDGGSTAQVSHELSVSHLPPLASFAGPLSVSTGQVARFDASTSSDPDGTITSYRWDFGDGHTLVAPTPIATHTYATGGIRAVTLTVVDDSAGTNLARHVVTVADRRPLASFTAPAGVEIGQTTHFDASASADPDGVIVSYRWDFGDGTTATAASPRISHTYMTGAARTVTLVVTDDGDNTARTQHTIRVLARRCLVPRLVGSTLTVARRVLRSRNCRLGAVRHRHAGGRRKGRVTGQGIRPGTVHPPGARVPVIVGS